MAGGGNSAAHVWGRNAARNQGPETQGTVAFVAGAPWKLQQNLNLSRPCVAVRLVWEGRIVVGTANYSVVAPEAPQSILQNILINGQHVSGNLQPWQISGASAFALPRNFGLRGNAIYIGTSKLPELTSPMGLAATTFGNTGTYDVQIHYWLPFIPFGYNLASQGSIYPFALQPNEWQQLQISGTFGDLSSFGTPGGGTTVAFSAYGSGSGSPTLKVAQEFYLASDLRAAPCAGAVLIRTETPTFLTAAVTQNQNMLNLQQRPTSNIIVKAGTILAGTSSGVQVFATLDDFQLQQTQVLYNGKPARNIIDNEFEKEAMAIAYQTGGEPQGYLPYSFVAGGNMLAAIRGDLSNSFQLVTGVAKSGGTQQQMVIQEIIQTRVNKDSAGSPMVWGFAA